MTIALETFLPGQLLLTRGTVHDYRALERFHYRAKRPATWAGVWVVRYEERPMSLWHGHPGRCESCESSNNEGLSTTAHLARAGRACHVVAVAVLSYPTVNSAARDRALGLANVAPRRKLAFVNGNVRTISRVIVHPQFRSLGLASRLVREICGAAPTRYVEAFAVMGKVHPFFEKGGMTKYESAVDGPVYYLFDREGEGRCAAAGNCAR